MKKPKRQPSFGFWYSDMRNQEQGNNTMSEMLNQEKLTMGSYTQVENVVIDKLMALLGDVEFRVFIAIYRKTIGWGKLSDTISTSQLMQITGKSNRAVIDAVEFLKNNGLISTENSVRNSKKFTINLSVINNSNTYEKLSLVKKVHKSTVKKVHSTCENSSQVTCENFSHTKETINKLTKERESSALAQNSESENLNAIEVFEFLKKSSVFGSELGIIQHREPNISELNVLIAEVTGYWSGKYLSKQQLLTKILSSVSRKNAQSRIDTYTMPKQQATTDAAVINTNRVSVSPFAKFLGDNV